LGEGGFQKNESAPKRYQWATWSKLGQIKRARGRECGVEGKESVKLSEQEDYDKKNRARN
jgi:hypothetical protein